ncbi:Abi family protein [Proteiniclasticum sp. SCR006]|uniref:Abi family protein n=1 Tax=Proteiniclasticum aestuarii TaxID=2817862 RepID=A0A939H5B1_9CLOT|nr:Abi family protein [Proteiniclasticum aestuarii]MBO1264444.1 Abi family protein [Proteiniclasticum aestuarii]
MMKNTNNRTKKKSVNALMKYMRDNKGISIQGSTQKTQLLNIGYYHGYKGYKYIGNPSKQIAYTNFDEILAIYSFDMNIKSILYPHLMHIETAFKSRALETCINLCSENFSEVYECLLDDYKKYTPKDKEYKKTLKLRLDLRNTLYSTISDRYQSGLRMIEHYHHKDKPVPLWAIFEIITLGQFGMFLKTMNKDARIQYSKDMNIHYTSIDNSSRLPEDIIFLLKDLRNAVAHNSAIFDCRFMTNNPSRRFKNFMEIESGINYSKNVQFGTITDYMILTALILKKLKFHKSEITKVLRQFQIEVEKLRKAVPVDVFNSILGTDTKSKLIKAMQQ